VPTRKPKTAETAGRPRRGVGISDATGLGPSVEAYLAEVAGRLGAGLGRELVGAWLFGSAAIGDFDPARSDLDVQGVTRSRLPSDTLRRLAARLSHESLPSPVRGLELVLYAEEDLRHPRGPAFQLNLNTGPRMEARLEYEPDPSEWFWFALDIAIGREHGLAVAGPEPADVFPLLSDDLLVDGALAALDWFWHHDHDGVATVLASCRSWAWASEGRWLSKAEAGEWAARRLADPAPVDKALARRRDRHAAEPTTAERAVVVQQARDALGERRRVERPKR
jgi:hypothetical protein